MNKEFRTLVDVAVSRAKTSPDATVYHMLADDGSECGRLTFGELDRRARAMGRFFEAANASGSRAVLLYPTGLDYITAFFGCLYGGVVAVPAYPPRMNRNLKRLLSIMEDCAPRYVLTDADTLANVRAAFANHPALESIEWIATDLFDFSGAEDWQPSGLSAGTLAFLQYTSGSTSAPKGVMVTHGNLMHNEALIHKAFDLDESTVVVSWLPIYHDMGLIGNVLAAVYGGFRAYLMSPAAFLRRPATWLEAVSRFGATASGGPNFAYDLCAQKVKPEDCANLDLSRWRIAFNGAEPVRAGTLERFAARFRPYGFRDQALFPCYGMAETTLFVTGGAVSAAPVVTAFDRRAMQDNRAVAASEGERHVGSGRSHMQALRIVDPASRGECPEGTVGEIWVSDASVATGYWNKPELSKETFEARLTGGDEAFLRTGDLGVLIEGELFVLGRLKDLIIIRGANHYPQDIELTAESSHAALRPGCSVAFAVDAGGEERLVLVAEVSRERRHGASMEEIGEAVQRHVAAEHGVSVSEVVLIQPATCLKTSSGKIQRSATRKAYLAGELEVFKAWHNLAEAPAAAANPAGMPPDVTCWLEAELCQALKIAPSSFDRNRPIAEYGLDSLRASELVAAIEERFGVELPVEILFVGEPSLSGLSSSLTAQLGAGGR